VNEELGTGQDINTGKMQEQIVSTNFFSTIFVDCTKKI
jgi:hypothetical protein